MQYPDLTPAKAKEIINTAYETLGETYPKSFYAISPVKLSSYFRDGSFLTVLRQRLKTELPLVFYRMAEAVADRQAKRVVSVVNASGNLDELYTATSLVGIELPSCFNSPGFVESNTQAFGIARAVETKVRNWAIDQFDEAEKSPLVLLLEANAIHYLEQPFSFGGLSARPSMDGFRNQLSMAIAEMADVSGELRLQREGRQLLFDFADALVFAARKCEIAAPDAGSPGHGDFVAALMMSLEIVERGSFPQLGG